MRSAVRVRLPWTVVLVRPVVPVVLGVLTLAAVATTIAHLLVGEYPLSPAEVLDGLRGRGPDAYIVTELRLPRALLALAAGAAFGVSGALLQRASGNDLASPDLLGVIGGAGLAVTILVVAEPDATPQARVAVALAGGLGLAVLVLAAAGGGLSRPMRVLLVGAGVSVVAQAVATTIVAVAGPIQAFRITLWLVGGLYGRTDAELRVALAALVVLVPVALLLGRALDHGSLGDDSAIALGVPLGRTRLAAFAVAVGLAAVAVAVVGPLAFVGLLAPHVARRLVGEPTVGMVAVSAGVGALVVSLADLGARTLLAPREIPAGVLVPLLGLPLLLLLLWRRERYS